MYGDKGIGTNHVLPTGRAARYTGGLWVGKFLKTVTWQIVTDAGNAQVAPTMAAIAEAENMKGHAFTARLRIAGIRGWICASSLGSPVIIVQVRIHSSVSGSFQFSLKTSKGERAVVFHRDSKWQLRLSFSAIHRIRRLGSNNAEA